MFYTIYWVCILSVRVSVIRAILVYLSITLVILEQCHDLAKQLSHYLYFFSFLFLFFYLGLTTQKEVQESVMSQVSHKHSHMTGSHSITSHDVT